MLLEVLLGLGRFGFFCAVMFFVGEILCMAQTRVATISLLEAAQSVIEKHPLIRYQEAQTDIDQGLLQQASGVFDTMISAGLSQSRTVTPLTLSAQEQYALIGSAKTDETSDLTFLNFGTSRLFRSGVSITGTVTVDRNIDNVLDPGGVDTSNPTVAASIPLLNGRGKKVVAAPEMAASTEVTASNFDLTFEISTLLFNAANDYWSLVADQKLLEIANEAESRAKTDLDNTQTLVDADRLPRENLNEVNANLAESASATIAAEQALIAGRYQLATDIGLDRKTITSIELHPLDNLPALPVDNFPPFTADMLKGYVSKALDNRSDFVALQMRIEEQKLKVIAAKNHLLPQLNLNISGGYSSLQEGRRFKDIFDSMANKIVGPNVSAGITYNFPLRNEAARGAYLQSIAMETQLESQSSQLIHSVTSEVISAAQGVRNAALEAGKAREAVDFYRKSLDGQREKYHLGTASVVDVLTVENYLTAALTTEVKAELAYAQALTQFRFATGTIVPPGKPVVSISPDVFQTLPQP